MEYIDRYDSLMQYYGLIFGIEWVWLKSQMMAESSGNPKALREGDNSVGLFQFLPSTWNEVAEDIAKEEYKDRLKDPFNPEHSIVAACIYLQYLYSKYKEIPDETERWKFTFAAYNAGRGNINQMLERARESMDLPRSYSDWVEAGKPRGSWQEWSYAKRFLSLVTGDNSKITIDYIQDIFND